ncbi:MAG: molybdopterin-guanine dinucleotide biosynthesis protein B [Oscillospiraceae bacterium]|nr:molybdopterin-guanine dinucleotide biosynthesis protein B [Oscillospiraceae bacterium]
MFCVSGYSDSGKTWLISKLINEFIGEGYSCAVLKHDGHDHFTDLPDSDTDIYTRSGAVCSAVFSDTRWSIHCIQSVAPEYITDKLRSMEAPPDVIIIEGLKDSAYPKVEIVRKSICDKRVCDKNTLICIASDCISSDDVDCPVYGIDDVRSIFMCIKHRFGMDIVWN